MENDEENDICPVCLLKKNEECQTPCKHSFCKSCVVRSLLSSYPSGICPVCRSPTTLYVVTQNGMPILAAEEIDTIFGSVYIQGSTKGLASYHFISIEESYVSYENTLCAMWPNLDDGSRPPARKPFTNCSYDSITRTFKGDIVWDPTSWTGQKLWRYEMIFSDDYQTIEGGTVIMSETLETQDTDDCHHFNYDIVYERYNKSVVDLLAQLKIPNDNDNDNDNSEGDTDYIPDNFNDDMNQYDLR